MEICVQKVARSAKIDYKNTPILFEPTFLRCNKAIVMFIEKHCLIGVKTCRVSGENIEKN